MSFSKKYFYSMFIISLLMTSTHTSNLPLTPDETTCSTPFFLSAAAVMISIPVAFYWYENYYKIDHTSVETLINDYEQELYKAERLIENLSQNTDIETTIVNMYPYLPYPYLTCHYSLNEIISHLNFYKKAFIRKLKQKKLINRSVINTINDVIERLNNLKNIIENSRAYKNELRNKTPFNSCPVCFQEN